MKQPIDRSAQVLAWSLIAVGSVLVMLSHLIGASFTSGQNPMSNFAETASRIQNASALGTFGYMMFVAGLVERIAVAISDLHGGGPRKDRAET